MSELNYYWVSDGDVEDWDGSSDPDWVHTALVCARDAKNALAVAGAYDRGELAPDNHLLPDGRVVVVLKEW